MNTRIIGKDIARLFLIYGAVTPAIQAYIPTDTDPRMMWLTLQEKMDIVQYESGPSYLRDTFHQEGFKPNDTIDSYIARILEYKERLVGTKQALTDEDIITKLLTRLPSTFQVLPTQPDRTVNSVIAASRRHAQIIIATEGPPEPTSGATNPKGLFAGRG